MVNKNCQDCHVADKNQTKEYVIVWRKYPIMGKNPNSGPTERYETLTQFRCNLLYNY